MRIIITVLFAVLLFWAVSCQKTPTETENYISPREMSWTFDTLRASDDFQLLIYDIWGSSPRDVWATGWDSEQEFIHYDGEQWEYIKIGDMFGAALYIQRVYGFSSTDVWFGGKEIYKNENYEYADSAVILHYDGVNWSRVPIEGRTNHGQDIMNIWGSSPEDVWFAGLNGELYHWDGTKIRRVELPVTVSASPPERYLGVWVTGNSPNNVYVFLKSDDTDEHPFLVHLLHWDGFTWSEAYRPTYGDLGRIWMSPGGTLYTVDPIRIIENGEWEFAGPPGFYMGGNADNNIIALHGDEVYHYNGKDWALLDTKIKSPELYYVAVWVHEEEVFIIGHASDSFGKSFLLHGK